MHKIYAILISLTVSLSFCSLGNNPEIVNIIIYDDFVDPQKTYESLINDFSKSSLIDSIKIVGRPIRVKAIRIKIDTMRVERFGIDLKEIDSVVNTITYKNFDMNTYNSILFTGYNENKFPLSLISEVILESEYFKPEIFLPTPDCFLFSNECVAKVELHCKKKNSRKLIKFIQENMQKYTSDFISETWRYEIVKNKLNSEPVP